MKRKFQKFAIPKMIFWFNKNGYFIINREQKGGIHSDWNR